MVTVAQVLIFVETHANGVLLTLSECAFNLLQYCGM